MRQSNWPDEKVAVDEHGNFSIARVKFERLSWSEPIWTYAGEIKDHAVSA